MSAAEAKTMLSDLTGLNLAEKKVVKDAAAKSIDPLRTKFTALALAIDFNAPVITTAMTTKKLDKAQYWGYVLGTQGTQILEGLLKWLETPDFKEAFCDAVKTVVISATDKDGDGRAEVTIASKVCTITVTGGYIGSQFDASDIKRHITNKIEKLL